MTLTAELGGSLQLVLCRAAVTDDADGVREYYTESLMRADYRRDPDDGLLRLSFEVCMIEPLFFEFVCGGAAIRDDSGRIIGWGEGRGVQGATVRFDMWSLNIIGGEPVGFFRWTTPACTGTRVTKTQISGSDPSIFEIATKVEMAEDPDGDIAGGFHVVAVDRLPDYKLGASLAANRPLDGRGRPTP